MKLAEMVQRGWDAVGTGSFDALVADYVDDKIYEECWFVDTEQWKSAF